MGSGAKFQFPQLSSQPFANPKDGNVWAAGHANTGLCLRSTAGTLALRCRDIRKAGSMAEGFYATWAWS